jgi:hypothetical protein
LFSDWHPAACVSEAAIPPIGVEGQLVCALQNGPAAMVPQAFFASRRPAIDRQTALIEVNFNTLGQMLIEVP